jgi:hypothetical protein
MKKGKLCDIILLCLKIILPILIAVQLLFFSYRLIEGRLFDVAHLGEDGYFSGTGLYFVLSALVLLAVNAFCTLLGIVGLVIAVKHKTAPARKKNITFLAILSLAPIGSQILYGLILVLSHTFIR